MIDTDRLRGIIVENRKSQAMVAKELGITPKTFYNKMEKGVFNSNEISKMIEYLNITDPIDIFFGN